MLSELRGLTPNYPFCGDILTSAQTMVRGDPESNRSWNFAWLCLVKIANRYFARLYLPRVSVTDSRANLTYLNLDSNLVATYAESEAARPEMWGGNEPDEEQIQQLAACFQYEWDLAVQTMLQHWTVAPTWY